MSNKRKKRSHRTTPAPPPSERPAKGSVSRPARGEKKRVEPFPLGIGTMMRQGLEGLRREPVALTVGGVLPIVVMVPFAALAGVAFDDDRVAAGVAFSIVAVVIGGMFSFPQCHYALRTARGEAVDLVEPFREWIRFVPMLVGSFWFWAGFLLAFQMGPQLLALAGPAIVMGYAFFGFVIDDRYDMGGLKALGTSVRIGDGRRFALLAIVCLYAAVGFVVYLLGFTAAVSAGLTGAPATIAGAVVVVPFIAFALVSWAGLYDVLRKDLEDAW